MTTIGIYGLENRVTGKWYVGQSINVYKRLGGHIDRLRRGDNPITSMQEEYNIYGVDAFEAHILEFCTKEELNKRECEWIKVKNAVEHGYNISTGGYSASGIKMSAETRKRLSEIHKGRVVSQETREKLSKVHKGIRTFTGRHHTAEAKEKIAQSKRGIPRPQSVKDAVSRANKGHIPINRRKVICIDTGEIFDSVRLAGESVGGIGCGVSGAITHNKTYRGLLFKYLDEVESGVVCCG